MLSSLSVRERWLLVFICFLVVSAMGQAFERRRLEQELSELKVIAVDVRLFDAETGDQIWDTSTGIRYRVIQVNEPRRRFFVEGPRTIGPNGQVSLKFASTENVEVEFGAQGYESRRLMLGPQHGNVRVNLSRTVAQVDRNHSHTAVTQHP